MNRNTNAHFAELPSVDISRSIFNRSCSHKTSGNVGQVIPVYVDPDIMPGDTVQMDSSKVIRFQTLLSPMMDNIQADFYWFFVPHRLVWDHWINFMGENTSSAWLPEPEYSVPKIVVPKYDPENYPTTDLRGTVLDYMGFPVNMNTEGNVKVNALPVRAYGKVMQDWFISENLQDPIILYTGDADTDVTNNGDYKYCATGGTPFIAGRYADYFSSCLPSPQKGDSVNIPLFDSNNYVPVYSRGAVPDLLTKSTSHMLFKPDTDLDLGFHTLGVQTGSVSNVLSAASMATTVEKTALYPSSLWADLSDANVVNVNDLRYAFQLQKLLERDARGGTRYIEIIKSHFGVTSPDSRLQRSEYLGGNRFGIVVDQVSNTAQTESDFLGDLGAFSVTSDINSDFTYSATEHGTILGLMVLRYDHTYAQGAEKFWFRDDRFSYYWPVFANIGEQPVYKKEIYCTGLAQTDDAVFGYNEAWADYRYKPNRVSGEMRPYVTNGLFSWSLTDDYDTTPSLSSAWLQEDKANVDRVLAVTSANANQFWCDIYFDAKYTRPMPVYSVPGLIDHN